MIVSKGCICRRLWLDMCHWILTLPVSGDSTYNKWAWKSRNVYLEENSMYFTYYLISVTVLGIISTRGKEKVMNRCLTSACCICLNICHANFFLDFWSLKELHASYNIIYINSHCKIQWNISSSQKITWCFFVFLYKWIKNPYVKFQ